MNTEVLQPRDDLGSGFPTLLHKELMRFWKVGFQTIAAPVLTALLYLLVFAHVLEGRVQVYGTLPYTAFLIPGLMMMSMLQNSFANPSSSLMQSRVTGNLVFVLLPPLSHRQIFWAYLLAAVTRGLAVGACIWVVALFFIPLPPTNLLWILAFAILSCG
ncbi:MAG: metal-dependent hydrolase, partial [Pusillimonas sp.]